MRMMVPAAISRILSDGCFLPCVFGWLVIYVVVFTSSPRGGTATKRAGTARLSILVLSQSAFQLVSQRTQNNPCRGKNDPHPQEEEGEEDSRRRKKKKLTKVRYTVRHKTTANKTECNKGRG